MIKKYEKLQTIRLKNGTIIVISRDPLYKEGYAQFTNVPLNLNLINNVEEIVVCLVFNSDRNAQFTFVKEQQQLK